MKGQNNLDKKKVRKEAIKMTAYTMIAAIGIEIVNLPGLFLFPGN